MSGRTFSDNVTIVPMEDIMPMIGPHITFYNKGFIGLLSLKMLEIMSYLVISVRVSNISRRNEMPMNYSLVIEPFDCWGFDLWVLFFLHTSTLTS